MLFRGKRYMNSKSKKYLLYQLQYSMMLFQIGLIVFDKNWFLTLGLLEVGNCTEELNCIDTVG